MQSPYSLSRTEVHGGVRFEASQYFSSIAANPKLDQSQLVMTSFQLKNRTQSTRSVVDFNAGKYFDWGGSHFAVSELYTSGVFNNQRTQVSLGRKIEFWSQVDSDWQLGLWEPKYNLDALRPMNQGLTGLFFKHQFGSWELLAYGTPVFIPTMNPEIKEQNGGLVSDSRWYKTPSRSSSVLNKDTQVYYSLNIPDIKRLVSNPGAGARLKWGGLEDGPWMSINLSKKPINTLLMRYDANMAVTSSNTYGEVVVGPAVGYHTLGGMDMGYYYSGGMVSVSYLEDSPKYQEPEKEAGKDWVQQQPGALSIYSLHSDFNFETRYLSDAIGLSFDYLRIVEKQTRDLDSLGGDRGSLLPYRMNFSNALSVKSVISSHLMGKRVLTHLKWLRDFDQLGTIIGAEMNVYPAQKWAFFMGADVLAVDDSSETNADPRFINQFRANDRVYGGMNYVF